MLVLIGSKLSIYKLNSDFLFYLFIFLIIFFTLNLWRTKISRKMMILFSVAYAFIVVRRKPFTFTLSSMGRIPLLCIPCDLDFKSSRYYWLSTGLIIIKLWPRSSTQVHSLSFSTLIEQTPVQTWTLKLDL